MRIGDVAALAGVHRETLRYYERRGLLPDPGRRASGYRDYTAEAVLLVRFIRRAEHLGFDLDDVEVLLALADGGPEEASVTRRLTDEKIAQLDDKIACLCAMRTALRQFIATCRLPPRQRCCPLVSSTDVLGPLMPAGSMSKVDAHAD